MSRIAVPVWVSAEEQTLTINGYTYDIAGVIFEARGLESFDLSLRGMAADYRMSGDSDWRIVEFVTHMRAVLSAELKYPIILSPEGALLDGRHRLARAIHENRETILAVQFQEEPKSRRKEE